MDNQLNGYRWNGYFGRGRIGSNSRYNVPVHSPRIVRVKKKAPMTFSEQARDYIFRLINLQRHMPDQYKRIDRTTVHNSIRTLENQLGAYPYETDEKMRRFWRKHRYEIKILLPSRKHTAFEKLLIEFEHLDDYASQDPENAIWQPIVEALNKF